MSVESLDFELSSTTKLISLTEFFQKICGCIIILKIIYLFGDGAGFSLSQDDYKLLHFLYLH